MSSAVYIFKFTHTDGKIAYQKVSQKDYRRFINNSSYELVAWPYP